jgi:hypothetical protein
VHASLGRLAGHVFAAALLAVMIASAAIFLGAGLPGGLSTSIPWAGAAESSDTLRTMIQQCRSELHRLRTMAGFHMGMRFAGQAALHDEAADLEQDVTPVPTLETALAVIVPVGRNCRGTFVLGSLLRSATTSTWLALPEHPMLGFRDAILALPATASDAVSASNKAVATVQSSLWAMLQHMLSPAVGAAESAASGSGVLLQRRTMPWRAIVRCAVLVAAACAVLQLGSVAATAGTSTITPSQQVCNACANSRMTNM